MKPLQYNIEETVENFFDSIGLDALVSWTEQDDYGDLQYVRGRIKPSLIDMKYEAVELALQFWQKVSNVDKRFEGMQLRFKEDTIFTIEP